MWITHKISFEIRLLTYFFFCTYVFCGTLFSYFEKEKKGKKSTVDNLGIFLVEKPKKWYYEIDMKKVENTRSVTTSYHHKKGKGEEYTNLQSM